jgi:LssY C-terminus
MVRRSALSLFVLLALTSLQTAAGEELNADTLLEVRLAVATGSGISRPGDPVTATIIAPVYRHGRIVVPQETTLSGNIAKVVRLGLGMKHITAAIAYQFDTLRLPDGQMVPLATRLVEVETAKERVGSDGTVHGINPTANLSSSVASYVWPLLYAAPVTGMPVLGVKFLIARSPDAEIYYPAGTEMILRVTEPVTVPETVNPVRVASFSPEESAAARRILERYPQQAEKGGKPSDLVNILFLGDSGQIDRAFHAAGWSGAERISPKSIYRMYHSLVERRGYQRAPMGKMTLKGAPNDAAYQKSLNTFSRRHHLRLWQDEQHPDAWLSTATEDIAIRLQGMHLTHSIDPRIDDERAKVVNDLVLTGCVESASLLTRSSLPTRWNMEGSGMLHTDGNIAVLRLNDCHSAQQPSMAVTRTRPSRMVRALVAVRKDVVRSNVVFVGYHAVKAFAGRSSAPPVWAGNVQRSPSPILLTPKGTRFTMFDAANRPEQARALLPESLR